MTKTIYLYMCSCSINEKREFLENQEEFALSFSSTFKLYFT